MRSAQDMRHPHPPPA